jgi:hypothetical protein
METVREKIVWYKEHKTKINYVIFLLLGILGGNANEVWKFRPVSVDRVEILEQKIEHLERLFIPELPVVPPVEEKIWEPKESPKQEVIETPKVDISEIENRVRKQLEEKFKAEYNKTNEVPQEVKKEEYPRSLGFDFDWQSKYADKQ